MQWNNPHTSASAPAFEDLMDHHHQQSPQHHHPPAMLPPSVQPPATNEVGLDDDTLAMIMGLEGLTAAEKQAMMDEQIKILKSIEDSKKSSQMSAADAFEQRSFSAAVSAIGKTNRTGTGTTSSAMQMHGQERTREAIDNGTAVMVQCTSCANWMQVTGSAQLMFCPVCQTVSPVQGSGLTDEEARQMAEDAKLAEQLQNEEYAEADRAASSSPARVGSTSSSSPTRTAATSSNPKAAAASSGSWMEWLGFGTPAPAPSTTAAAAAAAAAPSIRSSQSRDSDEGDGLLSGTATGRARVATTQPLFACVTDSIHSAANYALNGMHEDEEGNVHGVDASSLLAVTQVGRGGGSGTDSSNQRYEPLPDPH
jgi:hypothetical protein